MHAAARHLVVLCAALLGAATAGAMTCTARATTVPPRVVELYTSEGCSSCPPADQWLSTLKGRADVIALGFHVHYWDRLGWPDRFASEAYTRRQYDIAARAGSRSVYTPQVLVDGQDWRQWPRLPAATAGAAKAPLPTAPRPAPQLTLAREADGRVHAHVAPQPGASHQLGGYWAVVEHDHVSRVRSGENAGETLRHDHVVRLHHTVPVFAAHEGLSSRLDVPAGAGGANPRRVVFVVTSAGHGAERIERPVQALALDC